MTLLLLDLNGFKRYNDTFGHPAGDAMLTRLGGSCSDAVGDDGVAYRIGGDEFAVLTARRRGASRRSRKRAAEALTASGTGFELSAAWGAVAIPGGGRRPGRGDAARRRADVRAEGVAPRLAHDDALEIEAPTSRCG